MAETEPRGAEPSAPGEVRIRRALLSVSDKRGLVDFARGLMELGVEIVSTGGTARELEEQGIDTRPVDFGLATIARVKLAAKMNLLDEVWVVMP